MFTQMRFNLKFLGAILFAVTFLVGGFFVATGVAFATTPSTNDANRTNGWAHVDQLSVGVGTIDLSLIQPRAFFACFEYRTDGNTSQMTSPTNYNTDITDGLYPYKCLTTVGNFTKTLTADEYVEIRMVFGGEKDERFDWTRFDVVAAPVPMAINSSLPAFTVGVPATFTVGTVANDDLGKMVKAHFAIPAGVTVEYKESEQGAWIPLVDVYGPSTGFPLGDITSTFRGTFTEAGTKTVTVNFKEVGTDKVLGSKDITTTVVAAPVTPAAPSVTRDDTANTVTGMATGMEYKLDAASYVAYVAETFATLDFSGNHTLLIRVAAEGNNPVSADTTLTFTTNSVFHSSGRRATPAVPANVETPDGCAAGNKFSTTTGRNCNAATPAVPAGQVLGASTQAGQVLGTEKFNFTIFVKNGSNGNEIMELQKFLNTLGYTTLIVDGKFGPKTKGAVIKFQIANGLKGDGIVGPLTRAVLNK